jgi:hypothetical protein
MAVPAPPTNVVATTDSNSQVTVTWDYDPTWFAFDGNDSTLGGFNEGRWYTSGSVDHFEIEISRDGIGYKDPSGGPSTVNYSDGTTSYSGSYGPNSDNAYGTQVGIDSMFKFRVRSVNADGASAWVGSNLTYTQAIPPHNMEVSRPDNMSFSFSWENKSDIGDGPVIEARKDTGNGYGSWGWIATLDGSGSDTITQGDGENVTIEEDARYQFQAYHHVPEDRNQDSETIFCDYGNSGNVYFSDDFESGDFSAWDTTNLGDSKTYVSTSLDGYDGSGRVAESDPPEGSYGAQLAGGDYITENLGDLSGETDVLVKSYIQVGSLDSGGEEVRILWYDGSNWQTLESWSVEYNRQGWIEVTSLVPDSYLSTDNRVRFEGYGGSGDFLCVDRVVVSDILHEYTKPAAPSNPSFDNSVEDELTLSWTNNYSVAGKNPGAHHHGFIQKTDGTGEITEYPGTNATSQRYTGLSDGEKYENSDLRVYVEQSRHGTRDFWVTSSFASTVNAITRLPAPTALSASNITPTSADLSWTDNANNEDAKRVYLEQEGSPTAMDFAYGDYVESQLDSPITNGTISFWAKRNGTTSDPNYAIVDIGSWGDNTGWGVWAQGDANDELGVRGNSSYPYSQTTFKKSWMHIIAAFDGTDINLYVDNSNVLTHTNASVVESDQIEIGRRPNGEQVPCLIRDVKIHNRAVSSSERSALYNGETVPTGLVGYWPLDHNRRGETKDLSEYSNNGTVNGPDVVGNGLSLVNGNEQNWERGTGSFDVGGFTRDTTQASSGDYSLYSAGNERLSSPRYTVPTDEVIIEAEVYFTANSTSGNHVNCPHSGTDWGGPHTVFRSGLGLEWYDGSWHSSGYNAPTGEWITVRSIIDIPNQNFDVKVWDSNGVHNPITGGSFISRATFSSGDDRETRWTSNSGNEVYYDDVNNILSVGTTETPTGLTHDTTYTAAVETETEHSVTRDT